MPNWKDINFHNKQADIIIILQVDIWLWFKIDVVLIYKHSSIYTWECVYGQQDDLNLKECTLSFKLYQVTCVCAHVHDIIHSVLKSNNVLKVNTLVGFVLTGGMAHEYLKAHCLGL